MMDHIHSLLQFVLDLLDHPGKMIGSCHSNVFVLLVFTPSSFKHYLQLSVELSMCNILDSRIMLGVQVLNSVKNLSKWNHYYHYFLFSSGTGLLLEVASKDALKSFRVRQVWGRPHNSWSIFRSIFLSFGNLIWVKDSHNNCLPGSMRQAGPY